MPAIPKIGLFGGTFDPVHQGHLEIVKRAHDEFALDRVIILPCRRSPHKDSSPIASDRERIEMLKLATKDEPWIEVSDLEYHLPSPSFTWQTVEHLQQQHPPQTIFHLIIGLDQWEALPRWSHPEKLAQTVNFIVFGRNGQAFPREGYRLFFLSNTHPASSSEIRASFASGKKPRWLAEPIKHYLLEKNIYRAIP